MKYYKKNIPSKWQVFAFESDGSQDAYIDTDMISITDEQAKEIANLPPTDPLTLDIIRNASTKRNWSWPPKSYQEAIGQIAVRSSSIEVLIRTVIWHISGLDSVTGRAFTGKMRVSELSEVLKALIECKAPQLKKDTSDICIDIKAAFDKRAIYIHQVWTIKDGLPAVGKLFLERYERLETLKVVSLEDMYGLSDNMMSIENNLISKILEPLMKNGITEKSL
jgi:hypothetical protein